MEKAEGSYPESHGSSEDAQKQSGNGEERSGAMKRWGKVQATGGRRSSVPGTVRDGFTHSAFAQEIPLPDCTGEDAAGLRDEETQIRKW